jgi:hypothetical protein
MSRSFSGFRGILQAEINTSIILLAIAEFIHVAKRVISPI